ISTGYMSHLSRKGINSELGIDFEISKKIDISANLRYSSLNKNHNSEIRIKAISSFLSYILVNTEYHRLMIGPGISFGKYKIYYNSKLDKDIHNIWLNPVKIRYDYNINTNFKIGLDASLYGDDGDGSFYFGVTTGYIF
ncbi:MAG TPA: hypothetical protein VKA10_11950, partial [Prolixibacteraceae bacterium]|nr:hypothetical protein [Prolixibacteraceae bacterium]